VKKYLNKRAVKTEQGFTLIELLVVIIIIGILSAIALPSFLNQANKAKQAEAKTYTGTLNRVQQAHFLEKTRFAGTLEDLANPVPAETANYSYGFSSVNPPDSAITLSVSSYGTSKKDPLKSYVGMAAVTSTIASGESTTTAILCEANTPKATQAPNPNAPADGTNDRPTCGDGTTAL